MSEKIYACLLRLFPPHFRKKYGEEALQLFTDRAENEKGFIASLRLWFDLAIDLVISLPREYCYVEPLLRFPAARQWDGVPRFFLLRQSRPSAQALLLGICLSVFALDVCTMGLVYSGNHRLLKLTSGYQQQGEQRSISEGSARNDFGDEFVQKSDPRPSSASRFAYAETEQGAIQTQHGTSTALDATARQRVIENAITTIKQHHIDQLEAQKAEEALLAHERRGDDDAVTSPEDFARLATRQMREASGSHELLLLYSTHNIPERAPGPPPPPSAAYREEMQRIKCAFEHVEILPHNIGYLKLNAFPDASACSATAAAAMAKLNDADTLILDLRDNRGGFPSMVSLIAAYLFDHPEYLYCPVETTTEESWTRSPVPGNKLANKPVYLLISSRTISAAEQFTYNMKMLKRATLVGETTAGGAHAANLHSIGDNFYVGTMEVRAINPYAKRDWNDTGIEPDVKVTSADALDITLKLALKKLHQD